MDHLERLERLLCFALQCLEDASSEIRRSADLDDRSCLKHIGSAIVSAWEVRDVVHSIRPNLRPQFLDVEGGFIAEYERFNQAVENALDSERAGDFVMAAKIWTGLLSEQVPSHFRIQAQAGMYRASKNASPN